MPVFYPVVYQGRVVGKLMIRKKGLYYEYSGSFQLEENSIYRVYGITASQRINLGVCQPIEHLWHIRGKLAEKNLSLENIRFEIVSTNNKTFIPINEQEPICCLEQLDRCRFIINDGCPGLSIKTVD